MKRPTVKQFYSEGSTHPVLVDWLSDETLFVVRNSGLDEIQYNIKKTKYSPYYNESPVLKLTTSVNSEELTILRESSIETLVEVDSQLRSKLLNLPNDINSKAHFKCLSNSTYILIEESGDIWINTDSTSWINIGSSSLSKITVIDFLDESNLLICNAEGIAEVFNFKERKFLYKSHLHSDSIQDLAVLDRNNIITVGRDKALRCWNLSSKFNLIWSIEALHEHFINCCLKVNDDVWTGSSDGSIAIVCLKEHLVKKIFFPHKDSIRHISLNNSKSNVVSVSDDGTYNIYDSQNGDVMHTYGDLRNYTRCAKIINYSSVLHVVTGNTSGFIRNGIIEQYNLIEFTVCNNSLRAITFLNQSMVICGDDAGYLHLVDRKLNNVLSSGKTGVGITTLLLLRDNSTLIVGYRDGFIRKYTLSPDPYKSSEEFFTLSQEKKIHETIVGDIIEFDNNTVLTCSDDRTIKCSFVVSLSLLYTLTSGASTAINNLELTNKYIIATTDGGSVHIFHRNSLKKKTTYLDHFCPVRALVNVDNELVCTGSRTGEIRVWSSITLETLYTRKFRDRVLYLYMCNVDCTVYIVTEGELVSINLSTLVRKNNDEDENSKIEPLIIRELPVISKSNDIEIKTNTSKIDFKLKKEEKNY